MIHWEQGSSRIILEFEVRTKSNTKVLSISITKNSVTDIEKFAPF